MPNHEDAIEELVGGDYKEVFRTITEIPSGQTLTKAWLTIKNKTTDLDVDAVVQVIITTTNTVDEGWIEDVSGADGFAIVRFDLTPTRTMALVGKDRIYDIQVLTSAAKLYTPFKGKVKALDPVTLAVS